MMQISDEKAHKNAALVPGQDRSRWLNSTVVGAGITSALGDLCYETTTAILPGFLSVLGVPAVALGTIEGIADALSSFTKMGAGYFADKIGHRKILVLIGYALTPVGQAVIALSLGWSLILLGRAISWFGKGLRGPLRDAILVQAISPETRGRAFGFHRAMDTIGAVLGPLLGVVLLGWLRAWNWSSEATPFRLIFWITVIPGLLSAIAFLIMVRDPERSPNPALRFFRTLSGLPRRFKLYLSAIGIFGIGDFSHSLLILAATQLLTPRLGILQAAQIAALLYVLRNASQAVASYPVGWLADHYGHRPILTIGFLLGVVTAALTAFAFLSGGGEILLAIIFAVAGLYAAIQEALEPTITASMVPSDMIGTSYGALGTVTGTTKFISSTAVGLVWSIISPTIGFAIAAIAMAIGTFTFICLPRSEQ